MVKCKCNRLFRNQGSISMGTFIQETILYNVLYYGLYILQ
jgi:hypothetical protein